MSTTDDSRVPVIGISEWQCFIANYFVHRTDVGVIDDCVEDHASAGIDQIAWNVGRSTLHYWSELPHATLSYSRGTKGSTSWDDVAVILKKVCPLRRAIELCRQKHIPLLGRLAMNRHYGSGPDIILSSHFSTDNPQYRERSKTGEEVTHKLCYAIDEVQQERIDILLEVQQIGVDGLVLDFCRQFPMVMYHDAIVQPFMNNHGVDPRSIDSQDPEAYTDWFQYRCDIMTGFMERLRREVRRQEKELERSCPIIARVPDNAPWLMKAYSLDIERWCAEDLIDATMLSPFPISREDLSRHTEYHISVAHENGKACYGGIGSYNLIKNGKIEGVWENTGFYQPKPVYEFADRQYQAGVDAMSLYQSDSLIHMEYLKELLADIGDPSVVRERLRALPDPDIPPDYPIAVDWHSVVNADDGRAWSLRSALTGSRTL